MVDIEIQNVMGIERAVMPLDAGGIALVAGLNGSGKSSLLECIAAAAMATPALRQMSKKDTPSVLREGAEAGAIVLRWDGGQTRITFPTGDVDTKGRAPLATMIGIGAQSLATLSRQDAMREVVDRFKLAPTRDHVLKWLAERGTAISDKALDQLLERVSVSGWDAVHKQAREAATRDKGRWEGVAGTRWGAKVAEGWTPERLVPGASYDLDAEKERLGALQAKASAAREAVGVDRGRLDSLRDIAGRVEVWRLTRADQQARFDTLSRSINANLAERALHIDAADAHTSLSCPHCKKLLRLDPASERHPRGQLVALPPLTGDAIQSARDKVAQLDEDRAVLTEERDEVQRSLRVADAEVTAAERAAEEIQRIEASPSATVETRAALDAAEKAVREQRDVVTAIEAMKAAGEIHAGIVRTLAVAEMLSPDGVRAAVWKAHLTTINDSLAALAEGAGFDLVALGDDLSITYAERPWNLLSESERWRCEFVLAALMWEQERPGLPLLIDRFDVLHPQARGQALSLLHVRRISAVVAMTARDPNSVPDLEKAGYGTRWWMVGGNLAAIPTGT